MSRMSDHDSKLASSLVNYSEAKSPRMYIYCIFCILSLIADDERGSYVSRTRAFPKVPI